MLSALIFQTAGPRYAVALLVTGATLLIRVLLNPVLGDEIPYLMLFAAIAFSACFCGTGPSIAAVAFGVLGARYWLVKPTHSFGLPDTPQTLGILVFLFTSGVIIAFGELNQQSRKSVRNVREELEAQVKERTEELDTANRRLRELTGRVLHLQDEERRRIARELHDSAGQSLAALAMNVSKLETEVRAQMETLAKTATTAADTTALVNEITTDIRTVSYLLHPPMLDEAGLGPALRWYIKGFAERSKIAVELNLPDDFGRLPQDLETAIFRVVQECLTNILRHSESPTAKIRIMRCDADVRIEVRDQGKGIPSGKLRDMVLAPTPGVGIRGMRERIRQLGGTLEMHSEGEGRGTAVVALLPTGRVPALAASTGDRS